MSLVGKVGRRRPRAVIAMIVLYVVLAAGAITTLYPFMLMVSSGFKGPTDQDDNAIVPKFWYDKDQLYEKYVNDKYKQDKSDIAATRTGTASADLVPLYNQFLGGLPVEQWKAGFGLAPNQTTSKLDSMYREWLRNHFHGDIGEYNRAYLEEQTSFDLVSVPAELFDQPKWKPKMSQRWIDWINFKGSLPVEFRVPITARSLYQKFLKSKYKNIFDQVPPNLKGTAKSFEELQIASSGAERDEFFKAKLPLQFKDGTVEDRWAKWSGTDAPMPVEAFERKQLADHGNEIKGEMSGRNFRYVLSYMALNGRALSNTAIFALLAILTQLIVNPIAAYALSRYPIRATNRILLFLLATMAFPAEVAAIPSFLLLKDFGLLNTFAALVLPTAASGYMIFLLKGFFDSLPQELFEAGQLDGAKEVTLMTRIALPLSKPVLGYLALLAFMAAYGTFLYAFLVAQDQKMWTIMVFIYQLQTAGAPRSVLMAAFTLAAIPTLVIFLLCQRVIMRGIILPGER